MMHPRESEKAISSPDVPIARPSEAWLLCPRVPHDLQEFFK
jgi:hypothetical protein